LHTGEVKVDVKETAASEVDFAKIGVEEALKILQVGRNGAAWDR
jgi:hypothetical protein